MTIFKCVLIFLNNPIPPMVTPSYSSHILTTVSIQTITICTRHLRKEKKMSWRLLLRKKRLQTNTRWKRKCTIVHFDFVLRTCLLTPKAGTRCGRSYFQRTTSADKPLVGLSPPTGPASLGLTSNLRCFAQPANAGGVCKPHDTARTGAEQLSPLTPGGDLFIRPARACL